MHENRAMTISPCSRPLQLVLLLLCLPFSAAFSCRPSHHRKQLCRAKLVVLYGEEGSRRNRRPEGVYVRPSGAIERGSGFFVPGLEGPKVRLVVGSVLLGLTLVNHVLSSHDDITSFLVPEKVALVYSLLVLWQAAIEFQKTMQPQETRSDSRSMATSSISWVETWNSSDAQTNNKEDLAWACRSFLSLTPATEMAIFQRSSKGVRILYRLSKESPQDFPTPESQDTMGQAAFAALSKSQSGRVAVPSSHPAVGSDEGCRTVVLQQITSNLCWKMTSSTQLLAAFAKSDLTWLGQLARYIADTEGGSG